MSQVTGTDLSGTGLGGSKDFSIGPDILEDTAYPISLNEPLASTLTGSMHLIPMP
jgi:hypothetical protein